MSIGSRHDETGWLNDQNGERVLRRDAGGTWRLDMGVLAHWRSRKLLGRRVRIAGERVGFDILAVNRLEGLDEAP
ncbi:MAG: hypothetical protein K0S56_1487 [Microvirga sp.]|jgi:hypothetical protein|nr:hypothetical protein [Microvirga sp.]